MQLDLASLKSVREFVGEFHALDKKLNVLINNAGVALNFKDTKRQYTEENFELTIGTNHLGNLANTHLTLRTQIDINSVCICASQNGFNFTKICLGGRWRGEKGRSILI